MSKIVTILLIAALVFFLISTVKIVRIILTVALGIIYIPINLFNTKVQKWYFKMRDHDKVVYYCFTPFYWIIVCITFIISIPYEFVIAMELH